MTRSVAASAVQKQFGRWVDEARHAPVMVQRHGRDVVAMLSVEEYRRLRRLERDALGAEDIDDETAELIAAAEHGA